MQAQQEGASNAAVLHHQAMNSVIAISPDARFVVTTSATCEARAVDGADELIHDTTV